MDKIKLLKTRRQKLKDAGKAVRADIAKVVDDGSFIEYSTFSFSHSDFYGEDAEGEGVVTGFATIKGNPIYIVAQNYEVLSGGVSAANCKKIVKCMDQAEKNEMPILYLLSSGGVKIDEGVEALEGVASILLKATKLKSIVTQYLVVNGDVFGQIATMAGICDFNFFIDKKSSICASSPLTASAKSGVNISKFDVGGANGLKKAGLASFCVSDIAEIPSKIAFLEDVLGGVPCDRDDLNVPLPDLDTDKDKILEIFDDQEYLEVGGSYAQDVRCYLGRVGGMCSAVALVGEGKYEMTAESLSKLNDFAAKISLFGLPFIAVVNSEGIRADLETNDSPVLKEAARFVEILSGMDAPKISLVTKKAIGFGYTLFASKSIGYDYTLAFADAKIALFDDLAGAEIEYGNVKGEKSEDLAAKYGDEQADPFVAARGGYLDDIIEPRFVKQYLAAFLQSSMR